MRMIIVAAVGAVGLLAGASHAQSAGYPNGWVLNVNRCPDLVEDRRDRAEDRRDARVIRGWRDLREDRADRAENRRDEAVVSCPADAFAYVGARPARVYTRPATVVVRNGAYYRRAPTGHLTIIRVR